MAKLLALVSFLAYSMAFACPDLSGSYVYENGNPGPVLKISQTETDGVTVYTFDRSGELSSYAADGQERLIEDSSDYTLYSTIGCSNDALTGSYRAIVKTGAKREVFGGSTFTLDAAKNLRVESSQNGGTPTVLIYVRK